MIIPIFTNALVLRAPLANPALADKQSLDKMQEN
ncbi:hypothetical protein ENROMA047B_19405 [Enterobacter rongchengensis]